MYYACFFVLILNENYFYASSFILLIRLGIENGTKYQVFFLGFGNKIKILALYEPYMWTVTLLKKQRGSSVCAVRPQVFTYTST